MSGQKRMTRAGAAAGADSSGTRRARSGPARGRVVVVLGMHRSGTSALTRGLQVLGVDLGRQLIGAIPGNNDKGFWEDAQINGFNDGLLRKLGSAWDRLNTADPDALLGHGLDEERAIAAGLLRARIQPGSVFAFKDPRTAVLLPFWQQVFDTLEVDASYVVAVRNPAEVAQSLVRRDGMETLKALLLWLAYSVAAVRYTQDNQRVFVAYSSVMQDAERQLRRIAGALRLPSPDANPAELLAYADDFLAPELRHHVAPAEALSDPASTPPLVDELYQLLKQAADDDVPARGPTWEARWARIESRFADLLPLLCQMDRLETRPPSAGPVSRPGGDRPAASAEFVPLREFTSLGSSVPPEFRNLVHRWSLDSVQHDRIQQDEAARVIVSGWVWPKSAAEVRVAMRQEGVTRSYPMNVARPDVVQALQGECGAASGSSQCGFRYAVKRGTDFEIGFEVDGWLFWLYRAATPAEA